MDGSGIMEDGDPPQQQVALTIHEYFENPNLFLPHPDFIKDNFFVEEDTTLILAIRNLNVPAVSGLLAAGINPNAPNQKGVTPISAASHKGDTTIIQKLVDAGASVNAVNSTGSTALIQASHFGHLKAVQLLLAHGGIADFANSKGTTALMRASQEGYVDIVIVLLAANSEVNRKNNEGMNSLMLASQRGHDQVVLVLVKYGAAMDEQTSQGSTALMLACKRGHESVVEVLVACGAEIYMRDCRARSARDTALRRHHGALLAHLDTQVQVQCLQNTARAERAELLRTMRQASILNRLQYNPETQRILLIMQGVDRYECHYSSSLSHEGGHMEGSINSLPPAASGQHSDLLIGPEQFHLVAQQVLGAAAPPTAAGYCTSYANTMTAAPSFSSPPSTAAAPPLYRNTWTFPTDVCVANINSPVSSSFIASAPYRARHPLPAPPLVTPHRPGYAPWQWPVLLKRVFDLPLGVHELVIDFLPTPRIWKTCIHRLKRRVTLAPQVATLDISIMLDEMITDMCLFRPPRRQGYLVILSRNEALQKYLSEQWHMPSSLVQELVHWSDVQSLISRSADCDVSFKANLARKFLLVAASMYRYLSSFSNPRMLFSLSSLRAKGFAGKKTSGVDVRAGAGAWTGGSGVGLVNRQPSSSSSSMSSPVARSDSSGGVGGWHQGWGSSGSSGRDGEGGIGVGRGEQDGMGHGIELERDGEGHSHNLMDIDFLGVDIEDDLSEQEDSRNTHGSGGGQHHHHPYQHQHHLHLPHESFQLLPPASGGGGVGGGEYLEEFEQDEDEQDEEQDEEEGGEEDFVMQEQSDDDDL